MATRTHKRDVSFVKLVDPKFLSLVKSPANKSGFKVIRDDDGNSMKIRQRLVAKRSDTASLLAVMLPSGITETEAVEMMEFFNLGEDYSVYSSEDGNYVLRRADAENSEFPHHIEMGNGFSVLIDSKTIVRSDATVTGVALAAIEFDSPDMERAVEWLEAHDIDIAENALHQKLAADKVVAVRADVNHKDSRTVKLGEGITGIVVRSKETDVPQKVYRAVVEASYGNWGWGQLDFTAALAGPEFNDKSWDAISSLRNVLENIILYSELSLDDRKTLVENACEQFASYIGGLLEALPKGLIEKAISRNDETDTQEAGDMAKSNTESTKRDDEQEATVQAETAATETAAAADGKEKQPQYITRDEMVSAVTEAVSAAMEAHITRNDETTDKVVSAVDKLGEAVAAINTNVETVTRSMKTLQDEVEELGSETVTRSGEEEEAESGEETVQRSDNASPFSGMFKNSFK